MLSVQQFCNDICDTLTLALHALRDGWDNAAKAHVVKHTGYTTPTHSAPTAGVATGALLAANASRLYALFVNDSDTTVYLALGTNAAANTGIRLNANGGSYEMSAALGNLYTGAVNGISGIAGKVVLVTEGV